MWHELHAAVATAVWFIVVDAAKLTCEVWHESHFAVATVTGMCVAGLLTAEVVPLWQVSQVPVPTALAAAWVYFTPLVQLLVELWQLSHTVTPVCVAVAGLPVAFR